MINTDNSTLMMLAEITAANAKSALENLQRSRQPLASTHVVKAAQQALQAKLQTENVASKKKIVALDADGVAFEEPNITRRASRTDRVSVVI